MRLFFAFCLTIASVAPLPSQADENTAKRCQPALELKQSLAKLLYVPPRSREVIAEIWQRFDRVEVRVPIAQLLQDETDTDFSVDKIPFALLTWNPRTKEVRAAQIPTANEGPALLTRNMANIQLWFETRDGGRSLTAKVDKIPDYKGEFLKEEMNVDVGEHAWLRWNSETGKVEAVYF